MSGEDTRQRILDYDRCWITRWSDWLENSRALYAMPAQSVLGQVGCLPGRTIAFRRELLVQVLPRFLSQRFLGVFLEGAAIFGLFSFVALLLVAAGESRASIAGLVIAGFSVGGVAYSLAVTQLTRRWQPRQLMIGGGSLCAATFVGLAFDPVWQIQLMLYTAMGIGFYTLHGCIQVEASELSTTARGTAMSMHSLSFFLGHAAGPALYGLGFAWLGASTSVLLGGVVVMLTGLMCARYLRRVRL